MKTQLKPENIKMIFILVLLLYGSMAAQVLKAQNGTTGKTEMQKLLGWVGQWKGEGWMTDQSRQTIEFNVEENIQSKLDGRAILAEGTGTNKSDGVVGFQSLGLLYFNNEKKQYEMKSLLKDGNTTLATARFNEKGQFIWGFDVQGGRIQYTITLTDSTWNEKGEFVMETGQAFPIMEMNLKRVK